jgi:hypothetical protein
MTRYERNQVTENSVQIGKLSITVFDVITKEKNMKLTRRQRIQQTAAVGPAESAPALLHAQARGQKSLMKL